MDKSATLTIDAETDALNLATQSSVQTELDNIGPTGSPATARVQGLNGEPSLRTLTVGELDGEHQRWAADRVARQEAASREAQQRWQTRQERRRIEPPSPSRSTPDHRKGIGR